jgi:hypothetical protein
MNVSSSPAKGTTCFRSFSIGNDLFTTVFTAQMGRGKIQWGAFTSPRERIRFRVLKSKNLSEIRKEQSFSKTCSKETLGHPGKYSVRAVQSVDVVECATASPYTYSSTHRFPDDRTPIEATPLSATSAELGLGLGRGLGLGSHSSSHAPLLLDTLLSHNIPLPRVL